MDVKSAFPEANHLVTKERKLRVFLLAVQSDLQI